MKKLTKKQVETLFAPAVNGACSDAYLEIIYSIVEQWGPSISKQHPDKVISLLTLAEVLTKLSNKWQKEIDKFI